MRTRMDKMVNSIDIELRRKRAAESWGLRDELVLVFAGSPLPIPGGFDQTYPFRVHPEYRWLTDSTDPFGVLVFDPFEGWSNFVPEVTERERLFDGTVPREGRPKSQLHEWLVGSGERPVAILGAPDLNIACDGALSKRLRLALAMLWRKKDQVEISRIREAVRCTAEGFRRASELVMPGIAERMLQLEIEHAMLSAGADQMAYGSIVAAGSNASVFHAVPGERKLSAGELLLIDMGADVGGYCADVTRTYVACGAPSAKAEDLYNVVLSAQQRAIAHCRAGVEWRDVHTTAARFLSEGLLQLGLINGSADGFVESGAISLFFPHGVGHGVGLGVRDAGGLYAGREEGEGHCGVHLRVSFPLEAGYVMTLEPGLYFIPTLLSDPERRKRFASQVRWEKLNQWLEIGGVRIEDNLLITEGEPENLTYEISKARSLST